MGTCVEDGIFSIPDQHAFSGSSMVVNGAKCKV